MRSLGYIEQYPNQRQTNPKPTDVEEEIHRRRACTPQTISFSHEFRWSLLFPKVDAISARNREGIIASYAGMPVTATGSSLHCFRVASPT